MDNAKDTSKNAPQPNSVPPARDKDRDDMKMHKQKKRDRKHRRSRRKDKQAQSTEQPLSVQSGSSTTAESHQLSPSSVASSDKKVEQAMTSSPLTTPGSEAAVSGSTPPLRTRQRVRHSEPFVPNLEIAHSDKESKKVLPGGSYQYPRVVTLPKTLPPAPDKPSTTQSHRLPVAQSRGPSVTGSFKPSSRDLRKPSPADSSKPSLEQGPLKRAGPTKPSLVPLGSLVPPPVGSRKLASDTKPPMLGNKTWPGANLGSSKTNELSKPRPGEVASAGRPQYDRLPSNLISSDSPEYMFDGDVDFSLSVSESAWKKQATQATFHWVIYIMIHCFAGAIVNLMTKRLKTVPKGKIAFYIALSLLMNSMPGAFGLQRPFGPLYIQPLVFLKTAFAVSASMFKTMAVVFLHISDVVAIATLVPIGVSVGSAIVLEERISKLHFFAMALNVIGVILIIQPAVFSGKHQYQMNHLMGVLFALGSVLSTAQLMIVLRYMRTMTGLKLGFNGNCSRVILTLAATMATGSYSELFAGRHLGSLVMLSNINFVSLAFLGRALLEENAAVVTTVKQCADIILSMILENLFFGEQPDFWCVTGSVVIIISSVLVVVNEVSSAYHINLIEKIIHKPKHDHTDYVDF